MMGFHSTRLLIIIGVLILALIIVVGVHAIDLILYGDKEVHCTEDNGAEFTATISSNLIDIILYFDVADKVIQFKGTDGKIYRCTGMAEIG